MRRGFAGLCALIGVLAAAQAAPAADTVLDHYLAGLKSLHTDFVQTVTDAHGSAIEAGTGSLQVQRPGKFRWDYEPRGSEQSGQLLVADGKNLWFFDRELSQVTVKPINAALSATPIVLLSGSAEELRASFDVSAAAPHDGLSWVEVKPRSDQADFSDAQLGFKDDELARMLVHDSLGQTVQLDFTHAQRNAPVDPAAFAFKVPAGVDVIGTPQH